MIPLVRSALKANGRLTSGRKTRQDTIIASKKLGVRSLATAVGSKVTTGAANVPGAATDDDTTTSYWTINQLGDRLTRKDRNDAWREKKAEKEKAAQAKTTVQQNGKEFSRGSIRRRRVETSKTDPFIPEPTYVGVAKEIVEGQHSAEKVREILQEELTKVNGDGSKLDNLFLIACIRALAPHDEDKATQLVDIITAKYKNSEVIEAGVLSPALAAAGLVQDRTRISPLCNVVVDLFLANKTLDGSFRRLSLDIVFADLCNGFQKLEREPKTKDDKTPRSQELTQLCTRIVDFGNAIMKTHPVLVWEYFFYGLPVYLAATKTLTKRDVPMAITKALDELLERSEPAILNIFPPLFDYVLDKLVTRGDAMAVADRIAFDAEIPERIFRSVARVFIRTEAYRELVHLAHTSPRIARDTFFMVDVLHAGFRCTDASAKKKVVQYWDRFRSPSLPEVKGVPTSLLRIALENMLFHAVTSLNYPLVESVLQAAEQWKVALHPNDINLLLPLYSKRGMFTEAFELLKNAKPAGAVPKPIEFAPSSDDTTSQAVEVTTVTGIDLTKTAGLVFTIADIDRQTYLALVLDLYRADQHSMISKLMEFLAENNVKLSDYFISELFRNGDVKRSDYEKQNIFPHLAVKYPAVFTLSADALSILADVSSSCGDNAITRKLVTRAVELNPKADMSVLSTYLIRSFCVSGNEQKALLTLNGMISQKVTILPEHLTPFFEFYYASNDLPSFEGMLASLGRPPFPSPWQECFNMQLDMIMGAEESPFNAYARMRQLGFEVQRIPHINYILKTLQKLSQSPERDLMEGRLTRLLSEAKVRATQKHQQWALREKQREYQAVLARETQD